MLQLLPDHLALFFVLNSMSMKGLGCARFLLCLVINDLQSLSPRLYDFYVRLINCENTSSQSTLLAFCLVGLTCALLKIHIGSFF